MKGVEEGTEGRREERRRGEASEEK